MQRQKSTHFPLKDNKYPPLAASTRKKTPNYCVAHSAVVSLRLVMLGLSAVSQSYPDIQYWPCVTYSECLGAARLMDSCPSSRFELQHMLCLLALLTCVPHCGPRTRPQRTPLVREEQGLSRQRHLGLSPRVLTDRYDKRCEGRVLQRFLERSTRGKVRPLAWASQLQVNG